MNKHQILTTTAKDESPSLSDRHLLSSQSKESSCHFQQGVIGVPSNLKQLARSPEPYQIINITKKRDVSDETQQPMTKASFLKATASAAAFLEHRKAHKSVKFKKNKIKKSHKVNICEIAKWSRGKISDPRIPDYRHSHDISYKANCNGKTYITSKSINSKEKFKQHYDFPVCLETPVQMRRSPIFSTSKLSSKPSHKKKINITAAHCV